MLFKEMVEENLVKATISFIVYCLKISANDHQNIEEVYNDLKDDTLTKFIYTKLPYDISNKVLDEAGYIYGNNYGVESSVIVPENIYSTIKLEIDEIIDLISKFNGEIEVMEVPVTYIDSIKEGCILALKRFKELLVCDFEY